MYLLKYKCSNYCTARTTAGSYEYLPKLAQQSAFVSRQKPEALSKATILVLVFLRKVLVYATSVLVSVDSSDSDSKPVRQLHLPLCHSARLAQPNLPAQCENRIRGLNDHLLVKRRVGMFWDFKFPKIRIVTSHF